MLERMMDLYKLLQMVENNGQNSCYKMGLPGRSFINDIKADLHDENTVYAVLDNHKEGDFNPYLYKSTDRGQTWTSLSFPKEHYCGESFKTMSIKIFSS